MSSSKIVVSLRHRHTGVLYHAMRHSGLTSAEEVDDGADGWEGIALGRGEADIECGFELVAELDQVEGVTSEVTKQRRRRGRPLTAGG